MAEKMLDLGQGIEIWRLSVDETKEQDINARSMTKAMFERLQATIGRDKRLESLPLLALVDGKFEIVSGHHRIRAARAAGVYEIYGLVDVSGLTPDQVKAKQLAHNAIQGEDNEQLVARIYAAVQDVSARLESFIDPAVLGKTVKVSVPSLDLGIDYRVAVITFLPYQKERFDKAVDSVAKLIPASTESVYMAELEFFERFKALVKRAGKEYDIRATSAILTKVIDIALAYLGDEDHTSDEDDDEWVALRDIVGFSYVPRTAADVITRAVAAIVESKAVTGKNKWQALEYLAAEYLSGSK